MSLITLSLLSLLLASTLPLDVDGLDTSCIQEGECEGGTFIGQQMP